MLGGFPWLEDGIANKAFPVASDNKKDLTYDFDLPLLHYATPAALAAAELRGLTSKIDDDVLREVRQNPFRSAFLPRVEIFFDKPAHRSDSGTLHFLFPGPERARVSFTKDLLLAPAGLWNIEQPRHLGELFDRDTSGAVAPECPG